MKKLSVEELFELVDEEYEFVCRDESNIWLCLEKPQFDVSGHHFYSKSNPSQKFEFINVDIEKGQVFERPKIEKWRKPSESDVFDYMSILKKCKANSVHIQDVYFLRFSGDKEYPFTCIYTRVSNGEVEIDDFEDCKIIDEG